MDRSQGQQRKFFGGLVYLCFFLSGAAGLIYEIVWMRQLGLILGHTTYAITVVLGAFMAGLALGSFLFGKFADSRRNPLILYAILEAGIGLSAMAVPAVLGQTERLYPLLDQGLAPFALTLIHLALVTAILLVPTTLMGATLPVLSKYFVDELGSLGRKVGELYALNTFGATAGAAAAGFFLLPLLGMRATTLLAAAVNLGIAALILIMDRAWISAPRPDHKPSHPSPPAQRGSEPAEHGLSYAVMVLLLLGIGISGAASMVYEIAWTRALTLVIGSSIYAFSAMLTTFLVGLALGSFLFARIWGKRTIGPGLFGGLELAAGFTGLALVPVFQLMPDLVLKLMQIAPLSYRGALASQFGVSFLIMLLPTTLLGATFPSVARLCSKSLSQVGGDVGRVYALNTLGTIAGAFSGGLFLIPWIGVQQAMIVAAALNVAVGTMVVLASCPERSWRAVIAVLPLLAFGASVYLLPAWDRQVMVAGVSVYAPRYLHPKVDISRFRADATTKEILFYREGVNATVSVERTAQMTSLKVDGKVDASNGGDMVTQLMLGHLPLFLHPKPERSLVIGLGSGVTAGAIAQHPVKTIDVVEIEPAVIEASRFFAAENRSILQDPRVRIITADARHWMLAGDERYDVISSEPSNPWMAGVANLFSREFYQLARARLADNGIMVQWVHGYSLFPREFKMIVNTFRLVFPHTTIWRTLEGDYLLVGTKERLSVDLALLKARYETSAAIADDMAILGWRSPVALLTLFFLDEEGAARYSEGAQENTDDRPLLEFAAPLALYARTTEENYRALKPFRRREFPPIADREPSLLEENRLGFARAFWARGHREEALEQLERIPSTAPPLQRFERAKLLFALGKIDAAARQMSALAQREPQNRELKSYLRAAAVLSAFRFEETLYQHTRTSTGKPNPAEAHNNLGLFYNTAGTRSKENAFFDLAIDSFQAALRIEPEAYAIVNNLGNAYFEKGMIAEAGQAYRRALERKPDLAQSHFNLGLVYERQGAVAQAVKSYEVALKLQPGWELPLRNLRKLKVSGMARR